MEEDTWQVSKIPREILPDSPTIPAEVEKMTDDERSFLYFLKRPQNRSQSNSQILLESAAFKLVLRSLLGVYLLVWKLVVNGGEPGCAGAAAPLTPSGAIGRMIMRWIKAPISRVGQTRTDSPSFIASTRRIDEAPPLPVIDGGVSQSVTAISTESANEASAVSVTEAGGGTTGHDETLPLGMYHPQADPDYSPTRIDCSIFYLQFLCKSVSVRPVLRLFVFLCTV